MRSKLARRIDISVRKSADEFREGSDFRGSNYGALDIMGKHVSPGEESFRQIVLLIAGAANMGKTSTSLALECDKTQVIHGDHLLYRMDEWCQNLGCRKVHQACLEKHGKDLNHHLGYMGRQVNNDCAREFVEAFLESEDLRTEKPVIIIEGHVFGLPKIRREILKGLFQRKYQVWDLRRPDELPEKAKASVAGEGSPDGREPRFSNTSEVFQQHRPTARPVPESPKTKGKKKKAKKVNRIAASQ
ncbi:MAG: hypothetical protein ACYCOU_11200 [Sulfobacillus sp.]